MLHKIQWLMLLAILVLLSACSGDPETGPKEIKFDRDACERCRMVVSDPHYATEIRYFPKDKRSQVAKFDDFGCAVIWLKDKPWKDDDKTEIWVSDLHTGKWIDAKTAVYVPRNATPMEYGLGAQSDPALNGLTFEQAKKHVDDIEHRFNTHGQHQH